MQVQAYLFFDGRCEEAIEFYGRSLGAKAEAVMRFKDNPDGPECIPPGAAEKIMHANIRIGKTQIMASDGECSGKPGFQGFALTLSAPTDQEAERLFAALCDGGKVQMPMGPTFWATRFGMVADRFGVMWMVMTESET